jgi:hypothetical protein
MKMHSICHTTVLGSSGGYLEALETLRVVSWEGKGHGSFSKQPN